MTLLWNPWAAAILALAVVDLVLAAVVFAARPRRLQNRLLALFLFGLALGWGFEGFSFSTTDPSVFYAAFATEQVGWLLANVAYLAFLGTLDTPLSRPLGTRTARRILGLVFVAGSIAFIGWTEAFWTGVGAGDVSPLYALSTPLGDAFWLLTGVNSFYALFVAISLVRRSDPGTLERSQAKAYLAAFALQDVPYAVGMFVTFAATGFVVGRTFWLVTIVGYGLSAVLLAYGILKAQLFDIDLKVKRTVRQGTVVAALAGAYVVTNLGARSVMSADAAQTTGIVLTGLLLFALVPLQRFGSRLADATMPGVRDDDAYLDQRRIEVYQAALEEALTPQGDLPVAREATLTHLRGRLGLTDRDHALLLHAVRTPERTTITPSFEPGRTVLSRYRIEEVLGEGGQGTTYKALDTTLGREVVIKVIHATDTRGLLKEARALARIDHPNVVTIFDVERVGDHVYLVMEHLDGGSLKDRLKAGALDGEGSQRIAEDLLAGLQAIHDAALVHRDVKPSNVLLTLDGTAKIADLGIATTSEPSDQTTLGAGSTNARGTIAYMSPEQARGDKLTPASDLFSAGVTLYETYTGRPLFKPRPGESPVELQARVAAWGGFEEHLDDAEIEAWFARALAPSPRDRYESAATMRDALGRSMPGEGRDHLEARPSGDQEAV